MLLTINITEEHVANSKLGSIMHNWLGLALTSAGYKVYSISPSGHIRFKAISTEKFTRGEMFEAILKENIMKRLPLWKSEYLPIGPGDITIDVEEY